MHAEDVFCGACGTKYDPQEEANGSSLFLKYSGYLDNESLYNVALAKEQGIVKSDFVGETEALYRMLSLKGHLDSMYRYAMILLTKETPDPDLALIWLNKAASAGHIASKNYLDVNYGRSGVRPLSSTVTAAPAPVEITGSQVLSGSQIFASMKDSVVEIIAQDMNATARASGFVVASTGFIVTNAHAVLNDSGKLYKEIYVKQGDKAYEGVVLAVGKPADGEHDSIDLALLFAAGLKGARCATLGDSSACNNGDRVYLIGNSLGAGTCITSGIISDAARKMASLSYPYIMTDAAANHGNSGGPLLNEYGEVIGVLVAGIENAEGMNYAIPSNVLKEFLRYVISNMTTKTQLTASAFGELSSLTQEPTKMAFQLSQLFTGIKLIVDAVALIIGIIF